MRLHLALFLLLSLVFTSCNKELSPEEQLLADIEKIEQYLTEHNLTAQSTASGLHYIITEPGAGGHPGLQSTVKVKYKGYLLDGSVFDQTSNGATVNFPLSNLILSWQEGIPLLQKGGKGTFWSPSALGYGPSAVGSIPANSVLIFEIELVDF